MNRLAFDPEKAIRDANMEVRRKAAFTLGKNQDQKSRELLFVLLGDENWQVRKAAVDGFLHALPEEAFEQVFSALRDPDNAGLRNAGLEVLRKWGTPVLDHLYGKLKDSDNDVVLAVINLLGEIHHRKSGEYLAKFLDNENKNLVSASIEALGKIKDRSYLEVLAALLDQEDSWISFHVLSALGMIGEAGALPFLKKQYQQKKYRKAVLDAIGKIGDPEAVPFLMEVLTNQEDPYLEILKALLVIYQNQAPEILGPARREKLEQDVAQLFPRSTLGQLGQIVSSEIERESVVGLTITSWVGDMALLDSVILVLDRATPPPEVESALVAMGEVAVPVLLEEFSRRPDGMATTLLAKVFGHIADPRPVPEMIARLDTDSFEFGLQLLESLGNIRDPRAMRPLLDHVRCPDANVQREAILAIAKLLEQGPSLITLAEGDIFALFSSNQAHLRRGAVHLLGLLEGQRYDDMLREALKDGDASVRQLSVGAIAKRFGEKADSDLVPMLADESSKVRRAVLKLIGEHLSATRVDILLSAMMDQDLWVRAEAVSVLARHGGEKIVGTLLESIRNEPIPVQVAALRNLPGKMVDIFSDQVLVFVYQDDLELRKGALTALNGSTLSQADVLLEEALSAEEWPIRALGLELLANRKGKESLPVLLDALDREEEILVRQAVLDALGKINDPRSIGRLLPYLTHPQLNEGACAVFLGLGKDSVEELRREAQEVDFKTKMILLDLLERMEKAE